MATELRYSWLPPLVRVVDFEDYIVVRYKGKEIPYGRDTPEEKLKKDILEGNLEKLIKTAAPLRL